MKKDEVWERIKNDKDAVYGGSMLDMFLKTAEYLMPRHILEALGMGLGHIVNEDAVILALKKSRNNWGHEELRDAVIEKIKGMSGRLVCAILSNQNDGLREVATKLGDKTRRMSDDEVFNLAWTRIDIIEEVAGLFGERLKRLPPHSMMRLFKMTTSVDQMESVAHSMGGWEHVMGTILKGRAPECGIMLWGELAWVLDKYGTMERFVTVMMSMASDREKARTLAMYLRKAGSGEIWDGSTSSEVLTHRVLNILGD